MYITEKRQPTDYCPHCDCNHVIGEHPKDDESESQYWSRMRAVHKRDCEEYSVERRVI